MIQLIVIEQLGDLNPHSRHCKILYHKRVISNNMP